MSILRKRGGLGVGRIGRVVEAEELLRCVRQQVKEVSAGGVFGVDLFGFRNHLERHMVTAGGDAGRAALAEVGDKDGKDAACAGGFALRRGEDGGDLLVGHGDFVENGEELLLCMGGEAVY